MELSEEELFSFCFCSSVLISISAASIFEMGGWSGILTGFALSSGIFLSLRFGQWILHV